MKTTEFNTPYTKRPRLLPQLTITKCALCHVLRQPYWPGSLWPNVSLMKKHLDWWSWVREWGKVGMLFSTKRRSQRLGCPGLPACLSSSLGPLWVSAGSLRCLLPEPGGLGWCGRSSRYCCRCGSDKQAEKKEMHKITFKKSFSQAIKI